MSDTLAKAVQVLVQLEGHSREQARRFLGRCTHQEVRQIAESGTYDDFAEVMDQILKRQEADDARR